MQVTGWGRPPRNMAPAGWASQAVSTCKKSGKRSKVKTFHDGRTDETSIEPQTAADYSQDEPPQQEFSSYEHFVQKVN